MAITDWRSRPANPDHSDVMAPSENQDVDEDDDVYENFPGLNPVRW